jgi:hypothetical protein
LRSIVVPNFTEIAPRKTFRAVEMIHFLWKVSVSPDPVHLPPNLVGHVWFRPHGLLVVG